MSNKRFYFDGLFYQNEEEFLKAASHHAGSKLSPVSAERILKEMCRNIELNLFNPQEPDICNAEFKEICEDTICFLVSKFRERINDKRTPE